MTIFQVDVASIKNKHFNEKNFCKKYNLDYNAYYNVRKKNRSHFKVDSATSHVAETLIELGLGKWINIELNEKEIAWVH